MHNHLRNAGIKQTGGVLATPTIASKAPPIHFLMTFNLEFSKADSQTAIYTLCLSFRKRNTENPLADDVTSLCLL